MGMSVNPKIIVGIPLSEFLTIHREDKQFPLFDERGNKTGKFGHDVIITYSLMLNGENISVRTNNGKVYSDIFTELGLEDYPPDGEFGILHVNYESELSSYVVGIKIAEIDAMTNDIGIIKMPKILKAYATLNEFLVETYSCNVEPKFYLVGGASY